MNTCEKALQWIYSNTVCDDGGIILSSKRRVLYPEVTGYFIPTLIRSGEKELATSFAKKLCELQKKDGSWYDAYDTAPYIFDSGQILKGLLAIREILPTVDDHIIQGTEWILSNMDKNGRLVQPIQDAWGSDDSFCNDLIHLYVLSPIFEAARVFNRPDFSDKANRILDYYTEHFSDQILNFSLFSHFYAYVMEALVDCGKNDLAEKAMKNMERYVKPNGGVKGYPNVNWVCSTAMFQFAITWYKLGNKMMADKVFKYASSLQNTSGGWFGSYDIKPFDVRKNTALSRLGLTKDRALYLPDEEISWAVKFYLDALYYKKMSGSEQND